MLDVLRVINEIALNAIVDKIACFPIENTHSIFHEDKMLYLKVQESHWDFLISSKGFIVFLSLDESADSFIYN